MNLVLEMLCVFVGTFVGTFALCLVVVLILDRLK